MDFLLGDNAAISLLTLTFLEIILGIDNLIFISLFTATLPTKSRNRARIFGLSLAFIIRITMLTMLSWIMTLTNPLFYLMDNPFSFKNILLIVGGLFLIIKGGYEIAHEVFQKNLNGKKKLKNQKHAMMYIILQITFIDFIFSFDSIITAVAMTNKIFIMVIAVLISMILMLFASEKISLFLIKYPSLKIVALTFIFLVGVILLVDGFNLHFSKNYLYFSLFFTLVIEYLNISSKKHALNK